MSDFKLIKCRLKLKAQEIVQTRQPYTAYSIKVTIDNRNMQYEHQKIMGTNIVLNKINYPYLVRLQVKYLV